MSNAITIASPQTLQIKGHGNRLYYGADQEWFPDLWQRKSGCGPTSASHLLWYLAQTDPRCNGLVSHNGKNKHDFINIMTEVWNYVTPGKMGVNKTSMFIEGIEKYGLSHSIPLDCKALDIPPFGGYFNKNTQLWDFLRDSFENNHPVAFLNLSNGRLSNLDNWHWVTLLGFYPDSKRALMYDQGKKSTIDLGLWLKTTTLGGGFVSVSRKEQ